MPFAYTASTSRTSRAVFSCKSCCMISRSMASLSICSAILPQETGTLSTTTMAAPAGTCTFGAFGAPLASSPLPHTHTIASQRQHTTIAQRGKSSNHNKRTLTPSRAAHGCVSCGSTVASDSSHHHRHDPCEFEPQTAQAAVPITDFADREKWQQGAARGTFCNFITDDPCVTTLHGSRAPSPDDHTHGGTPST